MSDRTVGLSIAIIARDDVDALKETITSIRPIADEIIVLDTGSLDASRGEAQQLGAEVFEFTWCDDFSAARNACLEHVHGKWVLWLDAGETIACEELEAFQSFVRNEANQNTAYAMIVRVAANSEASAAEQVARIRLVPGQPPLKYVGRVRESLIPALVEAGITVAGIPYRIHRGAREHDLERKAAKAHRNIRLAELDLRDSTHQPRLLNCLGDAFQTLNDDERAMKWFRHALEVAEAGSVDALEAYYGLLTSLDDDASRQAQLELAVEASEAFPLDAQLLCAMGGYLQAAGRTEVAAQSYETAVRYGQLNPSVWHVAEVREIATVCYSIILQLQDKLAEATQVLEKSLEGTPSSLRVRRQLIELLAKRGEQDRALEQVRLLPKTTPNREALRSAVRGACLAAKQNWIAAKAYLRTAYSAGCREPLCLRWFAVALSTTGEQDESIRILEEWRECQPDNSEVVRLLNAAAPKAGAPQARQIRVDGADGTSKPTSVAPKSIRPAPGGQP